MTDLEGLKIELDGIGHLLSDQILGVPAYQRSYAWEERNVTALIQDVASAIGDGAKEYFLGSIVLIGGDPRGPMVVDGQQRLATVSIMIAAARDWLYRRGDVERARDVDADYLVKRDARSQMHLPRLRLNGADNDFYVKTILSKPDSSDRETAPLRTSHRRLVRAVELASEETLRIVSGQNNPESRLFDWLDYLRDRVKIIVVRVPDDSDAFTIFEVLNDRGADLSTADLLKNFIFSRAGDRIGETQESWLSMAGALEALDREELVTPYIRHFWSSFHGLTRERVLYAKIKGVTTSQQRAVTLASDLAVGARQYAALLNPAHELWGDYPSSVRRDIQTLLLLKVEQLRPLLLASLGHFTPEEFGKTLKLLVSWTVRSLITGTAGSGSLETQYCLRAVDIRAGRIMRASKILGQMQEVIPTDRAFESAFESARVSQNWLARYYLRSLERTLRGEDQPELVPNEETVITLEHVLPEHPSAEWRDISEEQVRDNWQRLGNMALMQGRANRAIGADAFAEKVKRFAQSEFRLTSALASYSSWGPAQIDERQVELAALAVQTWPRGDSGSQRMSERLAGMETDADQSESTDAT